MENVRAGQSRVVVLRGEAGVGKTALLDYLLESATGCRIARAAGVESEMELPFAGLHQLCAPMLEHLDRLPGPQGDALGAAFGLREGDAPDRFLVGLATLTLLAEVAEHQPLVCIVDDAQWLDHASAQILGFVARRLLAEQIALVGAARTGAGDDVLAGLPELPIRGLGDRDARALLLDNLYGPLDAAVCNQIIGESRGNPLALLELPRTWNMPALAGGFGLPGSQPVAGKIEQSYVRRLGLLPADTQLLVLAAAAEPVGDPVPVWRAAERLGVGVEAAAPAEAAGLVEFGGRVRFRHPLVRSAVYRSASPEARHRVHGALAEATDPDLEPDRRAWHRAHATPALDEDVAAELERSAGRAQARGGLAAAAAFLQRAAVLTPEPASRARRALAAAQSKHQAGAPDTALNLLAMAQAGPLDELQRARAELLRAQITFAVNRGREAPPLLLAAAKRLESLDATLARETYLDAFSAALFAGRLARGGDVREVAEAVLAADWGDSTRRSPRAYDLLLDGLAVLTMKGYAAAATTLKRALAAFRDEPMSEEDALRWLWLACRIARALGDDASWDELTHRQVQLARNAGALSLLPIALIERFGVQLFVGDLDAAASLVAEAEAVVEATGSQLAPQGAIALAAWRGDEAEASALIQSQPAGSGAPWRGAVADRHRVGQRGALQRPRPLPGRPLRRRAGRRAPARAGTVDLGTDRDHRGRRPERRPRASRRPPPTAPGDQPRRRHGLGAGSRGALTSAAERWRGGRTPLPRGDRAARPHPHPRGARPRPSALRRMVAPREPSSRRPRAAAHRPPVVQLDGHGGVRRAGPP